MTKALFKLFILFITCSTVISCSEQDSPELPDNPGNTNQGIASIDQTQINANGGGFIIRVKADGTWQASSSETWCTLSRTSGNGNGSISGYMKANTGAERSVIITIIAGKEKAEFTLKQLAGNGSNPDPDPSPDPDPNPDPDPEKPSGYAGRIEIPVLKGGSMNIFHTWTTKENGKETVTYSYEYDCTKKHVRWVAFTFDNYTCQSNVKRSDAWKEDTNIPAQYRTSKSDYNPEYTRGHMVGSGDRVYSRAANEQTFYYSNMSPQQQAGFNTGGGVWNNVEDQVQAWGQINNPADTLYVVKGGTIDKEEDIRTRTSTGVAVPKYYFIAVLSYKNKQYKGIAFYVEHTNNKTNLIKRYSMSIRELEQKTGINFFHNLEDAIENNVEINYNPSDWSWKEG